MPDGVRLAARAWIPEDASTDPVPAVLEMIPYRKRDGMARRDEMMHPFFAGHGYAAIRVDLRGAGDSEGLLEDEYAAQEQEDGLAVIAWVASQPWCTGAVGMIGISWGGFNSLQIAARKPAALKAVVSVGSTDDRYADDVHFMGGCLLSAKFTWAQTFFSDLSRPPDPAIVGDRWREMWLNRLSNQTFFLDRWLRSQTRDSFWKHGSICEDWGAIECAVFAVGGWADSYTNAVSRLVSNLKCPRLGMIGPWGHDYPHTAIPGPAIGFLQECLRWWDYWLKGLDSGIMSEPLMRIYLQSEIPATPDHTFRPGRWIGFDRWPVEQQPVKVFHVGSAGLSSEEQAKVTFTHSSPQTLGSAAGEWCPYGMGADQPAAQGEDDGRSLAFDSPPLAEDIHVVGTPWLDLSAAIDKPLGLICARLEDIDPEGRSSRISYGLLNVSHRHGHSEVAPATPGECMALTIKLCDTAFVFRKGHRIRIAISTAYWPTVWPSPDTVTATVHGGRTVLRLPLLAGVSTRPIAFAPPVVPEPRGRTTLRAAETRRILHRDYVSGEELMEVVVDDGLTGIDDHGLEIGRRCVERYRIHPDRPASASCEADWTMLVGRGNWRTLTETRAVMTCTPHHFKIKASLVAFVGDKEVFRKEYVSEVDRHGA
jgi:putative CocE/NonD family hydrolase